MIIIFQKKMITEILMNTKINHFEKMIINFDNTNIFYKFMDYNTIIKALLWTSLCLGCVILTYSGGTSYYNSFRNKNSYDLQPLKESIYQANLLCDKNFLLELVDKCNIDSWTIPPACHTFENKNTVRPAIFKCDDSLYLRQYINNKIDTTSSSIMVLGIILVSGPLLILCSMFSIIGVYNYLLTL